MNSHTGRVYLLGNCQAESIKDALRSRNGDVGTDVECRWLASPVTYLNSPLAVPPRLSELFAAPDTVPFLDSRFLVNQFLCVADGDPPPRAFVFTMFHEEASLFRHRDDGFVFYVSPRVHQTEGAMRAWVSANCVPVPVHPTEYLHNFFAMLAGLRQRFPDVPMLIVKRATHLPAYAPNPYSYLAGWGRLARRWEEAWGTHGARISRLSVLDLDRVVGGLWSEGERRIEQLMPYLALRPWRVRRELFPVLGRFAPAVRFTVQRDVEHPDDVVWERTADHVTSWLAMQSVQYAAHEVALIEQRARPQPAAHIADVLRNASTNTPTGWANLIEALLSALPSDHAHLLDARGAEMPQEKLVLRALRAYVTLKPTRHAAAFLETHLDAVRAGPPHPNAGFHQRYLREVEQMIDWLRARTNAGGPITAEARRRRAEPSG